MPKLDADEMALEFLGSLPDLIYVVDLEANILWWNDRLSEVTGYDDEELDGMNGFELVAPDQRELAIDAIARTDSFPPTHTMEFDLLTKDGRRVPYEFNGAVLELEDQTVVAAIARDVTARREREREIRRQRDELETLNSISETVYEVTQAVVDAANREEIESAVCGRLAASELYRAVWIGRTDVDGTVTPSTGVGETDDFVESVSELNELEWERPAAVAARTGEIQTAQDIVDSDLPAKVRRTADSLDINAGISVPVAHRGTVDGVLTVYSSRPDAFSEREKAAFERLGEVVGFATNAVRTEQLLLSDSATELTFRVAGPDAFLASVSSRADGPCRKEWSTPADSEEGDYRHYVTVSGLDTEAVFDVAEETSTVRSIEHVGENDDDQVFSVVTTDSMTRRLFELGATPTSVVARDGETTIVAEIPVESEVRPVVEAADEMYGAELVSKREVERPVRTSDEFYDGVAGRLTERQRVALRHAYFGGYFSWPRDATAEDVAERMGVSSPTFHYHVRHGQQALVEGFMRYLDGREDD